MCHSGICTSVCEFMSVHVCARIIAFLCMRTDLLQGSLDVYALSPGSWRVGKTLSSVAPARDVYPLSPQVLEGRGHDFHAVIC